MIKHTTHTKMDYQQVVAYENRLRDASTPSPSKLHDQPSPDRATAEGQRAIGDASSSHHQRILQQQQVGDGSTAYVFMKYLRCVKN